MLALLTLLLIIFVHGVLKRRLKYKASKTSNWAGDNEGQVF